MLEDNIETTRIIGHQDGLDSYPYNKNTEDAFGPVKICSHTGYHFS